MIARTFLLLVVITSAAVAQTRLLPRSDYDKTDEYHQILREVFSRIYCDDVTFSVLIGPLRVHILR
jgi:hypothetical protein